MKHDFLLTAARGFLFGALAFGAVTVLAWTGPSAAPPTCPAGNPGCDAPLNVGANSQSKAGSITASDVCTAGGKCLSYVSTVMHDTFGFSITGTDGYTCPYGYVLQGYYETDWNQGSAWAQAWAASGTCVHVF